MKYTLLLFVSLVAMPAMAQEDYGIDKRTEALMLTGAPGFMELGRERMARSRIVWQRSLKSCPETFPDNSQPGKQRLSKKEIARKLKALDKE